jgi:predicted metallopeptidase
VPDRPDLNRAIAQLIRDIARRMPEFSHVRASRIIVVAGEARRASRGTVKPLAFAGGRSLEKTTGRRKPVVRVKGRKMLYSITLRPLFFRDSTPRERVETILHELFHISPAFDGTLDRTRRHARLGRHFGRMLRPLVRRYLKECPLPLLDVFGHHGQVRVQQWLERPTAAFLPGLTSMRRVYTEAHLFVGPVEMITRPSKRRRLVVTGPGRA